MPKAQSSGAFPRQPPRIPDYARKGGAVEEEVVELVPGTREYERQIGRLYAGKISYAEFTRLLRASRSR